MTKENTDALLSLLRYALSEAADAPSERSVTDAHRLAKAHALDGAIYSALARAAYPEASLAPYLDAYHRTLYMNLKQDFECDRLLALLEERGVHAMLLKGRTMRAYYPEEFLRASSDIDLLVSQTAMKEVERLLICLGYEKGEESEKDTTYRLGEVTVEVHHTLFAAKSRFALYFADILTRSPLIDGCRYTHRMTESDLLLYLLAHAYKHATAAGTGVRTVLDIGLLCEKMPTLLTDPDFVNTLSVLGIDAFLDAMRTLYRHLIYGEEVSGAHMALLDYILYSGVYGNSGHRAASLAGGDGRLAYVFRRLFVPYSQMKAEIRWCVHPLLYPIAFFARIFKMLFRGKAGKHLSTISYAKKEESERLISMWKSLGIDINK